MGERVRQNRASTYSTHTRRSFAASIVAGAALGFSPARAQTAAIPAGAEPLVSYHTARGGRSLVIARNGLVRIDSHVGPRAGKTPIAEASSAYVALLAAALVADRFLDLDEPVSYSISEFALSPLKARMTLRHLLGRTSAIPAGASGIASDAIVAEPTGMPGETFNPRDAGLVLFCEVARRKLALRGLEADPAVYLQRRVLAPIGADDIAFSYGDDGWARLADGVEASASALLAAGELVRRGGVWRARWLVDPTTISECAVGNAATSRAGLGWWLGAGAPVAPDDPLRAITDIWQFGPALPPDLLMAAGKGGQRLFVLPTRRIVAARTANPASDADWSDAAFLRLLLATL
jgi:CubicO group peptidase (beta-lactamase class C family)